MVLVLNFPTLLTTNSLTSYQIVGCTRNKQNFLVRIYWNDCDYYSLREISKYKLFFDLKEDQINWG